jgi:hypothetical protein
MKEDVLDTFIKFKSYQTQKLLNKEHAQDVGISKISILW